MESGTGATVIPVGDAYDVVVGHPVPDDDVVGVADRDDGGAGAALHAGLAHGSPSRPATSAATSCGVRPAVSTRKVATRS